MLQHLFLFWGSFAVALSGAMMPGPMLTATVSETMKRGFSAGPLIVLGHALLELALLAVLVNGLSTWLMLEHVVAVLHVVGGALLVAMGVPMAWTAHDAARRALTATSDRRMAVHGPVLAGILTSLCNPYWTAWWATIGLSYAAVSLQHGYAGLTSFYAGHISADLAWYGLVAAAVASSRKVCSETAYRTVLVVCGTALAALGTWFLATGIRRLVP